MGDFRRIAKQFLANGLTTIPVGADKQSTINWTKYQDKHITEEEIEKYFKDCFGIAVLTGGLNRLECIDIDTKYDLTGFLSERYKAKCDNKILKKLWVQETRSGGFHWVYKTDVVEPNQKLASRETTPYEKYATLMSNFDIPSKRNTAFNVAANDKVRVLIETRGGKIENGKSLSQGYFLVAPTPGYKKLFGTINDLSDDERNHLVEKAREFNEFTNRRKDYKRDKINRDSEGPSPFMNFNEDGDMLKILFNHGWEEVSSNGNFYRLRRPGNPESSSSALYDNGTKLLNIFTTSYVLSPGIAYTPSDVFIELEAGGDTSEAYKLLKEMGF